MKNYLKLKNNNKFIFIALYKIVLTFFIMKEDSKILQAGKTKSKKESRKNAKTVSALLDEVRHSPSAQPHMPFYFSKVSSTWFGGLTEGYGFRLVLEPENVVTMSSLTAFPSMLFFAAKANKKDCSAPTGHIIIFTTGRNNNTISQMKPKTGQTI